jgi:MFS family permease
MHQRVGDLRLPAILWLGLFLASFTHFGLTSLAGPVVRDVGTTVANFQSVLVLLALVTAIAIPTSRNIGEIYGERRLMAAALALSVLAPVVGIASGTGLGLIVGFSILGGLAAAPLVSVPWTLMQGSFTGWTRSLALMALPMAVAAGSAVAPTVVGWITDTAGWRWAFLPQMALAGVLLLLVPRIPSAPSKPSEPVDWLGGVLALSSLAAILTGVTLADEYGWWQARKPYWILGVWPPPFSLSIAAWLILTGQVLLGLWIFERSTGFGQTRAHPIRLGALRKRTFQVAAMTAALQNVAVSGMMFALFIYTPFAFHLNSVATAIAILPYNIGYMVAAMATPMLGRGIPPRRLLQGGLILASAGALVLQARSRGPGRPWRCCPV